MPINSFPANCVTLFNVSCGPGSALIQNDGKIVIGFIVTGTPTHIEFARLNANGSLDTSFGNAGLATLNFFATGQPIRLLQLSDGSLLAAAQVVTGAALIRILANGTFDSSFGNNGLSVLTLVADVESLTVNPSTNDIYVGGKNGTVPSPDLVEHVSSSGDEDHSFGNSGLATVGLNSSSPSDLAFDSNNQRIVALSAGTGNTTDLRVVKILTNGQLDSAFGTAGVSQISITSGSITYLPQAVRVDSNGKVLVLGDITTLPPSVGLLPTFSFSLVRLMPDGSLDSAFGSSGTFQAPPGDFTMTDMSFTPDNELMLGGWYYDFVPSSTTVLTNAALIKVK